jgi:hypothetical protein
MCAAVRKLNHIGGMPNNQTASNSVQVCVAFEVIGAATPPATLSARHMLLQPDADGMPSNKWLRYAGSESSEALALNMCSDRNP